MSRSQRVGEEGLRDYILKTSRSAHGREVVVYGTGEVRDLTCSVTGSTLCSEKDEEGTPGKDERRGSQRGETSLLTEQTK